MGASNKRPLQPTQWLWLSNCSESSKNSISLKEIRPKSQRLKRWKKKSLLTYNPGTRSWLGLKPHQKDTNGSERHPDMRLLPHMVSDNSKRWEKWQTLLMMTPFKEIRIGSFQEENQMEVENSWLILNSLILLGRPVKMWLISISHGSYRRRKIKQPSLWKLKSLMFRRF